MGRLLAVTVKVADERVMQFVAADGKIHLLTIDGIGSRVKEATDSFHANGAMIGEYFHGRPTRQQQVLFAERALVQKYYVEGLEVVSLCVLLLSCAAT